MELIKLKDRVSYISNFTNIGVVKGQNGLILIDTGLEERTARHILKLLQDEKLPIHTILNTHSHADHCGGNKYIKEETGAQVIAPEGESNIIEKPLLEPYMFFSGAAPIDILKNKFLMASATKVDKEIVKSDIKLVVDGLEIMIVPLPGHSLNQVGFVIDQVFFCGDALFSPEVLQKHKIPFYTDISLEIKTLKLLKEMDYDLYLPSHSEPLSKINGLVEENYRKIKEIIDLILKTLKRGLTTEEVIRELFSNYNIKLKGPQHYYLTNTSVLAYLSYLYNKKMIKQVVKDNVIGWVRE